MSITPQDLHNHCASIYDADPNDPRVDEAIEYVGQMPDNVRHMRSVVIGWMVHFLEENG